MVQKRIWGMLHLPALPGNYNNTLSLEKIIEFVLNDVETLTLGGINQCIIENFGDTPFPKTTSQPHIIAAISKIISVIQTKFPDLRLGVNVLRNDAFSALGIASMFDCELIRVNVLTHARLTDQGIIEGCAYELIKYKQELNSKVSIWADVDVKHSAPLAEISLQDQIKEAIYRGGADKVIFTGKHTGDATNIEILENLFSNNILKPEITVIGSGITVNNFESFLPYADNFIIGTGLKKDNNVKNKIDIKKATFFQSAL